MKKQETVVILFNDRDSAKKYELNKNTQNTNYILAYNLDHIRSIKIDQVILLEPITNKLLFNMAMEGLTKGKV